MSAARNTSTGSKIAQNRKNRSLSARRWLTVGLAALALPALSQAQSTLRYTISTFAGTGTAGFAGDGGAAASAQLSGPCNILLDGSGGMYVADQLNIRIRKIDASGNINTVVGNGTAGNTGNGAAATAAEINYPCGMALDSSKNLYIADGNNHVVRKVSTTGTISTIAGTGVLGFSGDAAAATSAQLDHPTGIAVDSAGNVYIADSGNARIRKIGTDGNINTIAGLGMPAFTGDGGQASKAAIANPQGMVLDASGNLYFADADNHAIRRIGTDGVITTVAGNGVGGFTGDGPATQVELFYPMNIALDAAGNLFIADRLNSLIRVVTGGTLTTVAGDGVPGFSGDGGFATLAHLNYASGVAVDASGKVYIADAQNNRIRLLTPTSQTVTGPPAINAGGVISASAFGAFTSAAPGSWIEIYGKNLASNTRTWTNADFVGGKAPQSLDGTQVTIAGLPTYMSYISPSQVNVQLPSSLTTGTQQLTLTTSAGTTSQYAINISPARPGLLAPANLNVGGKQYVAALFTDNATYVLPVDLVATLPSARPAHPGEIIIMYGVGFGDTDPAVAPGQIVGQAARLTTPVQIMFGQTAAEVPYAGLVPGSIGLYQFNVVVPNVADSDAVPVTITVGSAKAIQTLYTTVQN